MAATVEPIGPPTTGGQDHSEQANPRTTFEQQREQELACPRWAERHAEREVHLASLPRIQPDPGGLTEARLSSFFQHRQRRPTQDERYVGR